MRHEDVQALHVRMSLRNDECQTLRDDDDETSKTIGQTGLTTTRLPHWNFPHLHVSLPSLKVVGLRFVHVLEPGISLPGRRMSQYPCLLCAFFSHFLTVYYFVSHN